MSEDRIVEALWALVNLDTAWDDEDKMAAEIFMRLVASQPNLIVRDNTQNTILLAENVAREAARLFFAKDGD